MTTIRIDNQDYDLDMLSADAKAQLARRLLALAGIGVDRFRRGRDQLQYQNGLRDGLSDTFGAAAGTQEQESAPKHTMG